MSTPRPKFQKTWMWIFLAVGIAILGWQGIRRREEVGGRKTPAVANNNHPAEVITKPVVYAPPFQLVSDAEKVPQPITIHVTHEWSPVVYSKSWGYFHWESEIGVDHWMSINYGPKMFVPAGQKFTSSVPTSNIRWCLADTARIESVPFTYWNELGH